MNWTEIEAKWAAMTRRVKSDQPLGKDNMAATAGPDQASLMPDEASELRAREPLDRPLT